MQKIITLSQFSKLNDTLSIAYSVHISTEHSPSSEAKGPHLIMNFSTFTTVCHLALSQNTTIQSTPLHPTSWKSNLILSSHLHLGLPTKTLYASLLSPSFARPTHSYWFDDPNDFSEQYRPYSSKLLLSPVPLPHFTSNGLIIFHSITIISENFWKTYLAGFIISLCHCTWYKTQKWILLYILFIMHPSDLLHHSLLDNSIRKATLVVLLECKTMSPSNPPLYRQRQATLPGTVCSAEFLTKLAGFLPPPHPQS